MCGSCDGRKFKRSFDSLKYIFSFTEAFLTREGIDRVHLFPINFAVEEIFTNMVKYNRDNTNEILIRLNRDGERLLVRLTDFDVDRFDPTAAPDVAIDRPLEERTPGGLGLHLTRRLMDRVEYEYADRQSRITLTKRIEQEDVRD